MGRLPSLLVVRSRQWRCSLRGCLGLRWVDVRVGGPMTETRNLQIAHSPGRFPSHHIEVLVGEYRRLYALINPSTLSLNLANKQVLPPHRPKSLSVQAASCSWQFQPIVSFRNEPWSGFAGSYGVVSQCSRSGQFPGGRRRKRVRACPPTRDGSRSSFAS